jgi:hypothetical protein
MKLKLAITLLVGIIIGALAHGIWQSQTETARHWKAVRKYNAYMRNPQNYKPTGNGFTMADEPLDPEPHLAYLASKGELIHADIVLPSVPYPNRAVTKHWKAFCERHPEEIIFAAGRCDPGPNHLEFWFTEAGRPLFDQLIEELKEMGSGEEPTTESTPTK